MNRFNYYLWRLKEEFCKRFHIIHLFETKVGVKGTYGLKPLPAVPISNEFFKCSPEELFLGVDLLKDNYTLLGCPLLDSPHFYFMKALYENQDIVSTDYIKRYESGTLDGRVASLKHKNLDFFKKIFKEKLASIENNDYRPVLVYRIGDRLYIYDGKHRAALCAYMRKKIICRMVSNERFGFAMRLILDNNSYSKHLRVYSAVSEE